MEDFKERLFFRKVTSRSVLTTFPPSEIYRAPNT